MENTKLVFPLKYSSLHICLGLVPKLNHYRLVDKG